MLIIGLSIGELIHMGWMNSDVLMSYFTGSHCLKANSRLMIPLRSVVFQMDV